MDKAEDVGGREQRHREDEGVGKPGKCSDVMSTDRFTVNRLGNGSVS